MANKVFCVLLFRRQVWRNLADALERIIIFCGHPAGIAYVFYINIASKIIVNPGASVIIDILSIAVIALVSLGADDFLRAEASGRIDRSVGRVAVLVLLLEYALEVPGVVDCKGKELDGVQFNYTRNGE